MRRCFYTSLNFNKSIENIFKCNIEQKFNLFPNQFLLITKEFILFLYQFDNNLIQLA